MRTFTSQVSQFRSSEMECIGSVDGRWSLVARGSSLVPEKPLAMGMFAPIDQRLTTSDCFFYPASFPIIVNNGMYREITIPPMLTPRRPMMTGSSMANMSLVAESTSSS